MRKKISNEKIRGWLLIYVIWLILFILRNFWQLLRIIDQWGISYFSLYSITTTISLGMLLMGLFSIIFILKKKKKAIIINEIFLFLLFLIYLIQALLAAFDVFVGLVGLIVMIPLLLWVFFWIGYFFKSKRVKKILTE